MVYVDWEAPLLVRQFHRLTHTTPADARLTLATGPHTAELRCTLFSR